MGKFKNMIKQLFDKKLVRSALALTAVSALLVTNAESAVLGLAKVSATNVYAATTPAANWGNISDYSYIAIGSLSNEGEARGSVYVNGNLLKNIGGIDDHTGNSAGYARTKSYLNGTIAAAKISDTDPVYEGQWERMDGLYWYKNYATDAGQTAASLAEYWNGIGKKYGTAANGDYGWGGGCNTDGNKLERVNVKYYNGTAPLDLYSPNSVVIAPNADVRVHGKWCGTIVAQNIYSDSSSFAAAYTLNKNVDGLVPEDDDDDETPKTPVTYSQIIGNLDKPLHYGYFSDEFSQPSHTEATVCTNKFNNNSALWGLQLDNKQKTIVYTGTRQNSLMGNMVTVNKTYLDDEGKPVSGKYIKLGVESVNEGGKSVPCEYESDVIYLNPSMNGKASVSFYVPNGTYKAYVLYSEDGNKWSKSYDKDATLEDGKTDVHFLSGEKLVVDGNKYGQNVSYIGESFAGNMGFNTSGVIVAGSPEAYKDVKALADDNGNILNGKHLITVVKGYENEYGYGLININGELDKAAAFSEQLLNAKSSNDVAVYNYSLDKLKSFNDGDKGKIKLCKDGFGDGTEAKLDYKLAVVNVDVTGISSPSLSNGCVRNNAYPENVSFGDIRAYSEKYASAAARTIFNFYEVVDGVKKPYTGNLNISELSGVILAPKANVSHGTVNGTVIAKSITANSENHQISFLCDGSESYTEFEIITGGKKSSSSSSTSSSSSSSSSTSSSSSSSKSSSTSSSKNEKPGRITIKKVDADDKDKVLEGAVFTIKLTEANPFEAVLQWFDKTFNPSDYKKVTGKDGLAVFDNLKYATYTITEISAPEGYKLGSDTSFAINVNDANYDKSVTIENKKTEKSSSSSSVKTSSSSSEKTSSSSSEKSSSSSIKSTSSSSSPEPSTPKTSSSSRDKSKRSSSKSSSSSSKKPESSSSEKTSSSSSEKSSSSSSDKTSSSSSKKPESSSSEKSSSSSSEKTSSSSSEKSSSSSSKKPESSSSEKTSSSSSEKTSSSSSEKSSSSSSEKTSSSSSEKSSSSSSEKTSSSSSEKSSSSSSEKKNTNTTSSSVKDSSSSSEKDSSSSSVEKDSSSSSVEKDSSSSSVEKDSSSSSEKDSSSSSVEKDSSSSSVEKDSSSSSVEKDSSSSSVEKDSSSSSVEKSSSSSSEKKTTNNTNKKKKKSSSSDEIKTTTVTFTNNNSSSSSTSNKETKKSSSSSSEKKNIITKTTDVLGDIAAPVVEAASGVLGDIAAPLTGDDMNPTAWLALALLAAGMLFGIVVFSKKKN